MQIGAVGALLGVLNEIVTFVTHEWYEPTFIGTYADRPAAEFYQHLAAHYFFLLPLGHEAASRVAAVQGHRDDGSA